MDMNRCPVLNQIGQGYQSHYIFGEQYTQRTSTPHDKTDDRGYLAIGEVFAVHPKRYSVDVKLRNENTTIVSSDDQEGDHAAKIGVVSAGFSNLYEAPYGEIQPIHRGDLVLIGFIKNSPQHPIVLKVFHDTTEDIGSPNYRNILPNVDSPSDTDITDYLKITPIQDFHKVDKDGNFELSSHTKSFIIGQETQFDEEKFDYEDLSVKSPEEKRNISAIGGSYGLNPVYDISDKVTTKVSTKTIQVAEKYSTPKKYMAVFRDNFKDTATNWLRFVVDSSKTAFKIIKAQQKANKTTYVELGEDGSTTLKRQLDTRTIKGDTTKIFTDIKVDANGTITIETIDKTTKIKNATEIVPEDIASADSESTKVITEQSNMNNSTSSDTFVTEIPNQAAKTPKNLQLAANSSTATVESAFIAPVVDDVQLFNFPEQPKLKLFSLLNATSEDTDTVSSDDNSTVEPNDTVESSSEDTDTSVEQTYTTTSSTYTTVPSKEEDDSEDLGDTAQTTITINPRGGSITIKTTSVLRIDALKGISMESKDGAVSISAKKGVKIESSEGYFYGKAKKQVVLKNDNASVGFTQQGDATMKNKMGALNVQAGGQVGLGNSVANTQISADGKMSSYGTSIATTAPKVETTGVQRMLGGVTSIGSMRQIGMNTINGRFNVVAGDRDSRGHRNFALFCNFVVAMVTQFVINQVVAQVVARLPHAAAIIAVVEICAGGFNAMKDAGWKGMATSLEEAAKGALIDPNSPLYKPLHDYCEKKGFGDALSIAAQVQFLTDPEPPGQGMSVMAALDSIAYDIIDEKAAAWGGAAALWTVLGAPNGLKSMATSVMDGLSAQIEALSDSDNLMTMAEQIMFNNLETMATNMGCNVHIVEEDGYYNVVSTYDQTACVCMEELGHILEVGAFTPEGTRKTDSGGSDSIASGDNTVPATGNDTVEGGTSTVSGGTSTVEGANVSRNLLLSANTVTLFSGNNSEDTIERYTTIEDKLIEINEYYDDNVFDAVYRTEKYLDGLLGTNSAQYSYINRRKRTTTGGGGSSGQSTRTTIRPADITDTNQLLDRFVKRLVSENCIRQLTAADQAVRYACSSELTSEIEHQATSVEIDQQKEVANGIRPTDIQSA